jgi:hypothetical protein
MLYLLMRSRRPRILRPARFRKRGGRANRRRCARWRRFPSDCRIVPHSNMRSVVLCRKFLQRGICVSFASNKRGTQQPSEERAEGEAKVGRTIFGRGRLNLKQTRDDNLPWEIAARGGGCMLYGISVVFDQVPFSNDALLDALDVARTPPPARIPDGPPSTP